jgi:hypothetical protein
MRAYPGCAASSPSSSRTWPSGAGERKFPRCTVPSSNGVLVAVPHYEGTARLRPHLTLVLSSLTSTVCLPLRHVSYSNRKLIFSLPKPGVARMPQASQGPRLGLERIMPQARMPQTAWPECHNEWWATTTSSSIVLSNGGAAFGGPRSSPTRSPAEPLAEDPRSRFAPLYCNYDPLQVLT